MLGKSQILFFIFVYKHETTPMKEVKIEICIRSLQYEELNETDRKTD